MDCRGKGKLWPGEPNVERLFKLRHIHQGAHDRTVWRARHTYHYLVLPPIIARS